MVKELRSKKELAEMMSEVDEMKWIRLPGSHCSWYKSMGQELG